MQHQKLTFICLMSMITMAFSIHSNAAVKLKFAHVNEVGHVLHQGALASAQKIEELSKGRVTMGIFPASSLGREDALNESLSLGTVDIIHSGTAFTGTSYGPISITGYPFILKDIEHWKSYRDSELFKQISQGYNEATGGNQIISMAYYGARHVTSNKAVLKPEDMQGLKIRVPNAPAYLIFPEQVGANPTPLAFSEVYLALQQGVVDAQENPLTTIKAKKFYEVQSHINLTSHIVDSIFTIISPYTLEKLSDEDKKIVFDVLTENADWVTEQIVAQEAELAAWFEEQGIIVNEVDRQPFIDAVVPALIAEGLPYTKEQYEELQVLSSN